MEATIIAWHKKIGDAIDAEDIVVEVATDKVDSEIPSPASGKLIEILVSVNEVVPIGGIMARIDTGDGLQNPLNHAEQAASPNRTKEEDNPEPTPISHKDELKEKEDLGENDTEIKGVKKAISQVTAVTYADTIGYYSPLVKNIARMEGISLQELESISGSGGKGRVTKYDLIEYIQKKKNSAAAQIPSPLFSAHTNDQPSQPHMRPLQEEKITQFQNQSHDQNNAPLANPGDEIIAMDRMRKVIASHMKQSQEISATVTSFVEADATLLLHWRNKNKVAYKEKYGETLTLTHLFVEAVIEAIRAYPAINAMIDGVHIILKKQINIGIATAMENGNLIVPVIRDAGSLNIQGLTAKFNDLTARARVNRLTADEIQGGTFTISNIGTYGNIMGTPIINQPQLAILALGAIKKKPVIQETPHGDIIAIRHMMFLSLSFDHRVIDGYLGGVFLNRIAKNIEAFDNNRSI